MNMNESIFMVAKLKPNVNNILVLKGYQVYNMKQE